MIIIFPGLKVGFPMATFDSEASSPKPLLWKGWPTKIERVRFCNRNLSESSVLFCVSLLGHGYSGLSNGYLWLLGFFTQSLCYERADPLKPSAFDFVIEIYQNCVFCYASVCWAMGIQGDPEKDRFVPRAIRIGIGFVLRAPRIGIGFVLGHPECGIIYLGVQGRTLLDTSSTKHPTPWQHIVCKL